MARFEEIMMFLPWIALIIGSISEPIGIQSLWKITQEICYHFTIKRNKKNKLSISSLYLVLSLILPKKRNHPSISIQLFIFTHFTCGPTGLAILLGFQRQRSGGSGGEFCRWEAKGTRFFGEKWIDLYSDT
jgi:hypothetical protein